MRFPTTPVLLAACAIARPAADPRTLSVTAKRFPGALPGKVVTLRKYFDPATGRCGLTSDCPHIRSAADLERLAAAEDSLAAGGSARLGPGLRGVYDTLSEGVAVPVCAYPKYPPVSYLDKTRHTSGELERQGRDLLRLRPLPGLEPCLRGCGARPVAFADGAGYYALMTKAQIRAVMGDPSLAQLEAPPGELPLQSGAAAFQTFATSAYNPASAMPSDALGQGIAAATLERGLNQAFLDCEGIHPVYWDNIPSSSGHTLLTFLSLADAAPKANLYHKFAGSYVDGGVDGFITGNGIKTMSLSFARDTDDPNSYEFLVMDDYAYRAPFPVFNNPAANGDYSLTVNWVHYNGINVGNVRHTNLGHYEMAGCSQARNPKPVYGGCESGLPPNCPSDREMPHLLAPGIPPTPTIAYTVEHCQPGLQIPCGTSFSAPTVSGIAADVMSADARLNNWPEKVRVALLATAQNVDGGEWDAAVDGRDGAGVVSGSEAVAFARRHQEPSTTTTPTTDLIYASSFTASRQGQTEDYAVLVPSNPPAGKHLRIVLTWDSNPGINSGSNQLSDLDLAFDPGGPHYRASGSWDGNVEIVDVPRSELTPGATYKAQIQFAIPRFAADARANFSYYAIGWTWVKDHAD